MPGSYFTGDGARVDEDGYFTVVGRVDDVLNVSGHRIGTAEIESAIVSHPAVAEAAAVGRPDDLKGQALVVFVTLKHGPRPERRAPAQKRSGAGRPRDRQVRRPRRHPLHRALPKTRSGKIMRRLLKEIAAGKATTGDTSTLEDLGVLAAIRAGTGEE
jgi:acetyl-CoA synthetase